MNAQKQATADPHSTSIASQSPLRAGFRFTQDDNLFMMRTLVTINGHPEAITLELFLLNHAGGGGPRALLAFGHAAISQRTHPGVQPLGKTLILLDCLARAMLC